MKIVETAVRNQESEVRIIAGTLAAVAVALCPGGAGAQSSTNASPVMPFYEQALAWGTSFNTNAAVAWTNQVNANWELSTGDRQVAGFGAANYLIGQRDIGAWAAGIEADFHGAGSVICAGEARGSYAFVRVADFKIEAALGAGYGENNANVYAPVIEPEIGVKKKFTANTFGEIRLSEPVWFRGKFDSVPTIKAGVGFTF